MTDKKDLSRAETPGAPAASSPAAAIDAFVSSARKIGPSATAEARGRLVFALDATMSRQPTWDLACKVQAQMFEAADKIGGLAVQLVYFRGFDECRASKWVIAPSALTEPHDANRLSRRPYPDRPRAAPRPQRGERAPGSRRSSMSATPWRSRSTRSARQPASSALLGVKALHVPRGADPRSRATPSRRSRG